MSDADVQRGVPRGARRVILAAFPATIGAWLLLYWLWPAPTALPDVTTRLVQAVGWSCVAGLFCLGAGIEAVAHERLQTTAFDPFAGRDSHRLQVNQRFLQNTLEQFALLAPGLLGAACYAGSPASWRIVPATALVWIATRYAFWIGYHRSPAMRAFGVTGLVIPPVLLLYVAVRFGHEMLGLPLATLTFVLRTLLADTGCRGCSVCIFDPDLDPTGEFAKVLVDLLGSVLVDSAAGSSDRTAVMAADIR